MIQTFGLALALAACGEGGGGMPDAGGMPDSGGGTSDQGASDQGGVMLDQGPPPVMDMGLPTELDADFDGISDADEGRATDRDTDDDGTPDYLDVDSDDDGRPDIVEAGDYDLTTPPVDSDGDMVPDYLDDDSDDNGIPDADEPDGDTDRDGTPDRLDDDDDGDGVSDIDELDGSPMSPPDGDMDGIPDHVDVDRDNDLILDADEAGVDTDGDGTPDIDDLDSDDDGFLDVEEAGDFLLATEPVDTDDDGEPDFQDLDADGDLVSDEDERLAGTDPLLTDSDNDGADDLIERIVGTNPRDASDTPTSNGETIIVLPHGAMAPAAPELVAFSTRLQSFDLYLLPDVTGSLGTAHAALADNIETVVTQLSCAPTGSSCTADEACGAGEECGIDGLCYTATGDCVPSVFTGVGYYEFDYVNVQSLQSSAATTSAALGLLTFGGTEHMLGALVGVVDPEMSPVPATDCAMLGPEQFGCPAFRSEAVRLVFVVTDEDSDGPTTVMEAGTALTGAGVFVSGAWTGPVGSTQNQDLQDVVQASGALDSMGAPLFAEIASQLVHNTLLDQARALLAARDVQVELTVTDLPGDDGDALQFIDRLVTAPMGGAACTVAPTDDLDMDGADEVYTTVRAPSRVCWNVETIANATVPATTDPQVFRARLTAVAGGRETSTRV